jgi:hypothetical protein
VTLAAVAGAAIALSAAPAFAGGGVVGEPQPELAAFKVGASGGNGSGAALPDHDLLLATPSKDGTAIVVCLLHRGGRSCASNTTLHAYKSGGNQDTFYGTAEVVPTGGQTVDVVALDCCNIGPNGAVIFRSTDGGHTWSGLIQAGDIASIGTAAFVDGTIVVGSFQQGALQLQALAPEPSVPQASFASPPAGTGDNATSVTSYKGGVLVASDDLSTTFVEYAKAGSALNTAASYKRVAVFPHEQVVGVSNNALVTDPHGSLTGGDVLRFFNGTSFGPPHRVPDSAAGDDGYFSMQECGSTVHVFFLSRRTGYDAFEETSADGVHWSALQQFQTAIHSTSLMPVLDMLGTGVLDETAGQPLFAQPILNRLNVHVAFASAHVHVGGTATLNGGVDPTIPGRQLVTLQELVAGRWYPVKSTYTHPGPSFFFRVPGRTATYRVVANQEPGYLEYGYSRAVTLTAT